MKILFPIVLIFISGQFYAFAGSSLHSHQSVYSGQEKRLIKSLSANDITELRRGRGWGLALAAELNGMPGPVHLLDMRNDIDLNETQIKELRHLYNAMQKRAIEQGEKLIILETLLDNQFKTNTIDEKSLADILEKIAKVRKELRFIHLSTHLKSSGILSEIQISMYNQLRGYTSADPCMAVPKGHNQNKWRKHNSCE